MHRTAHEDHSLGRAALRREYKKRAKDDFAVNLAAAL
jgi:hypothetical protein